MEKQHDKVPEDVEIDGHKWTVLATKLLAVLVVLVFVVVLLLVGTMVLLGWSKFFEKETVSAPDTKNCLILIGGDIEDSAWQIEYYHPINQQCDNLDFDIGTLSTDVIIPGGANYLSGCYLSAARQLVTRESRLPNKPPMIYGLKDGTARPLALPHNSSVNIPEYISASTTKAVSPTRCLSCGGFDGERQLKGCYQFDSTSIDPQWTPITPLNRQLANAASVSLGTNNFYVVGGHNGTASVKQLYQYDSRSERWQEKTSLTQGRAQHAATPLSATELLICGGHDYPSSRADCEVYSSLHRRWRAIGSMKTGRRNFGLTTFNGNVYAIGGMEKSGKRLKSVERYDRETDKWVLEKELKHGRSGFLVVVL